MSFIDGVTNYSIYYSTIDMKLYIAYLNDIIKSRVTEPEFNSSEISSLIESPEKIITRNSPRNSARKRVQHSASTSGIQFVNPKRILFTTDPSLDKIKEKERKSDSYRDNTNYDAEEIANIGLTTNPAVGIHRHLLENIFDIPTPISEGIVFTRLSAYWKYRIQGFAKNFYIPKIELSVEGVGLTKDIIARRRAIAYLIIPETNIFKTSIKLIFINEKSSYDNLKFFVSCVIGHAMARDLLLRI